MTGGFKDEQGRVVDVELVDGSVPVSIDGLTSEGDGIAAHQANSIVIDGVEYEVKSAFENIAASDTDEEVVAAVTTPANKKIRVVGFILSAQGTATDITFQSNAVAISPVFQVPAEVPFIIPASAFKLFETVAGEGLKATTGAGSTVGVLVQYVEI